MSSAIGSVGAYSSYAQDLQSVSTEKKRMGQQPSPEEMFSKIDSDGDGKLSTDELKAFQTEMEKNAPPDGAKGSKPPDASQMMSDMDSDGDGAISEDEWNTFMQKMQENKQSKQSQSSTYTSGGESGTGITASVLDARV
jgi:Ca2+-binding EF-hand superfamily protein